MKPTIINLIIFGIEKTGTQVIQQIITQKNDGIDIRIPAIVNDTVVFYENIEKPNSWDAFFDKSNKKYEVADIIARTAQMGLENLIAVDTTHTQHTVEQYPQLLQHHFDIISVNDAYSQLPETQLIYHVIKKTSIETGFTQNQSPEITAAAIVQRILKISHNKRHK